MERFILKFADSLFCLIEPNLEDLYCIFYFINCILQLQNFCLAIFTISISFLNFSFFFMHCSFLSSLNWLSVFSCILQRFLKIIILNYFAGTCRSPFPWDHLLKIYCGLLVVPYSLALFMFLIALCWGLRIWRRSQLCSKENVHFFTVK